LQENFKGKRDENCFEIPAPAQAIIAWGGIDTSHLRIGPESGGFANTHTFDSANAGISANIATKCSPASCAFAYSGRRNPVRRFARCAISAYRHAQSIAHTNTDATPRALRAGSGFSPA
jgi:hypothetical protein